MAAAFAYEPPSLNRAWEAFVAHLPTLLVIWLITMAITAVGSGVSLVFALLGVSLGGADPAALTQGALDPTGAAAQMALLLGQLGQVPFAILSSLVGVLLVAVPALHYETGTTITVSEALRILQDRPMRYLLAGLFFALVTCVGLLLCLLPGFAVLLVAPVYVNRIFATDQGVLDAFASSFQAVFRSPHGMAFVGVQALVGTVVLVVSICTCGLAALVAIPVGNFYIQNSAYHQGVIS
ncbi:hypothetical protein H8F24_02830 [Synechococcus sp. CBW1002]|uniref:hypothetical protein n=1 Tax=unclassified Synechococcus TaxID=2626047 RepID=UPI0018CE95DE|nr:MULTISPECIES: hypothetical protein [unclassified Synechococcus]QPN60400.1 hypothetical protein H8F24_02830 [Synechococcus sp. CBW1002]QPN67881.1 hypothetical protein H8F26_07095 [Synechococcus sp. CBW1006]